MAEALLNQPYGYGAKLTLIDGTIIRPELLRVTDRFAAVRESGACENIEFGRIEKVKWERVGNSTPGGGVSRENWWMVPVLPLFVVLDHGTRFVGSHNPLLGSWESIQSQADGAVDRVYILYGNNIGTVELGGWLFKEPAFVRTGRYRVDGENLHLQYADNVVPESLVSIRFECDQLILETPAPAHLVLQRRKQDRAFPPIVGRWRSETGAGEAVVYDFRGDGTFQSEKVQDGHDGSYEKGRDGELKVHWTVPARRDYDVNWKIHLSKDHLVVESNGVTVKYERRPTFWAEDLRTRTVALQFKGR